MMRPLLPLLPRSILSTIPSLGLKQVASYLSPAAMKLTVPFFAGGANKKESSSKRTTRSSKQNGKSASFSSTTSSSSSDECATTTAVTTPRTVLPPPSSGAAAKIGKPVTREDLEVALRRVVSSEAELAEMLADAAGSGAAILLEEIVAAEAQAPDEGELKETFAVFDADGDGRISAEELMAVLASLGDDRCSVEDCRRMIGGVDADGDGFVCFNEFTRMMTQGV